MMSAVRCTGAVDSSLAVRSSALGAFLFVAVALGCVGPRQGGPRDPAADALAAIARGQAAFAAGVVDGTSAGRLRVEMADDSNSLFVPVSAEITVDGVAIPAVDIAALGSGQTMLLLDAKVAPGWHKVHVTMIYRGGETTRAKGFVWTLRDRRTVDVPVR